MLHKTRSTSVTIERAGVNSLHGTSDARDHKREIGPRGSADASIKSRSYYYRLFHSLSLTNFPSLSSTFSPRFVSSPSPRVLERDLSRHTCCIFRWLDSAGQRLEPSFSFFFFFFFFDSPQRICTAVDRESHPFLFSLSLSTSIFLR